MKEANRIMEKHPEIVIASELNSIRRSLSSLNRETDIIIKSEITSELKRIQLQDLDRQRLLIAQYGNKLIRDIKRSNVRNER